MRLCQSGEVRDGILWHFAQQKPCLLAGRGFCLCIYANGLCPPEADDGPEKRRPKSALDFTQERPV